MERDEAVTEVTEDECARKKKKTVVDRFVLFRHLRPRPPRDLPPVFQAGVGDPVIADRDRHRHSEVFIAYKFRSAVKYNRSLLSVS